MDSKEKEKPRFITGSQLRRFPEAYKSHDLRDDRALARYEKREVLWGSSRSKLPLPMRSRTQAQRCKLNLLFVQQTRQQVQVVEASAYLRKIGLANLKFLLILFFHFQNTKGARSLKADKSSARVNGLPTDKFIRILLLKKDQIDFSRIDYRANLAVNITPLGRKIKDNKNLTKEEFLRKSCYELLRAY